MRSTGPADAPEIAVRAALAAQASTRALADASFEPVRGGLSNHAWKVEEGGRDWFVRLGGPESATLGVDRESERALLAVVGAAGLAPPLVACDPSNGLLVTEFIAGGPWGREDARAARNVERVAERLRVLHGLEPSSGIRRVDFEAQARALEVQLGALVAADGPVRDGRDGVARATGTSTVTGTAIRHAADSAFGLLARRRAQPVPCHNDLHHLNLLDDGSRLWLVDWEYGGVGDPLLDLASFACQHEFGTRERAALIAAYGAGPGSAGEIQATALDAACTAFDYVQWLWYSIWAARHPDAGRAYALRAEVLEARLAAGSQLGGVPHR
jgi:thiamine kinase-like enzyme